MQRANIAQLNFSFTMHLNAFRSGLVNWTVRSLPEAIYKEFGGDFRNINYGEPVRNSETLYVIQ